MLRTRFQGLALVIGGLVATAGYAGEQIKLGSPPPPGKSFYRNYLAPQMQNKLHGEIDAVTEFVNRDANPWMRDDQTVERVQRQAISATKKAVKRYAVASMHLDTWSLPLFRNAGNGPAPGEPRSFASDIQRARVRFGISHLRPKAEVVIPSAQGRLALSAEARGVFGASFDTPASDVRFRVSYDRPERVAAFTLGLSF